MREEANMMASNLQATANEEIAQHKAEIEEIKAKLAADVLALEEKITAIKKESKQ